MPLTRNLYDLDEVYASFWACLLRGRLRELAFWTQELWTSLYREELEDLLLRGWCFGYGVRAIGWLYTYQESKKETLEEMMSFVLSLARVRPAVDASILGLLLCGMSSEDTTFERTNSPAIPSGMSGGSNEQLCLARALMQGKALSAWKLLRSKVWDESTWQTLTHLMNTKHGSAGAVFLGVLRKTRLPPLLLQASAVCVLSSHNTHVFQPATLFPVLRLDDELKTDLEHWEHTAQTRTGRAYEIPREFLYGWGGRGALPVSEDTEGKMIGSHSIESRLQGSRYWDTVAELYQGWDAIRDDDEEREEFFEAHFPDDIPDEWSSKDRQKSHGRGVLLQSEPAPRFEKMLRTHFWSAPSIVLWGSIEHALLSKDILELRCSWKEFVPTLQAIYETRREGWRVMVTQWDLTPVKRIVELSRGTK